MGVDKSKFKNCEQSSFCQRHRNHQPFEQDWSLDLNSLHLNGLNGVATLVDLKNPQAKLELVLSMTENGAVRMKIDQLNPTRRRFEPRDALSPDLRFSQVKLDEQSETECVIFFPPEAKKNRYKLTLTSYPFKAEVTDMSGKVVVMVNSRGLMRYEIHQELSQATTSETNMFGAPKQAQAYDEAGRPVGSEIKTEETSTEQPNTEAPSKEQTYAEIFSSFTDLRPYGPMSVGVDIHFPNSDHVYGIPEHTDGLPLKDTSPNLGDPYRLYNVDIFEYEMDSRMSLYGAIPFMISHSKTVGSFGVFWFNAAETWIDVESNNSQSSSAGVVAGMLSSFVSSDKKMTGRFTHWFSETGLIDIWFMPGPEPSSVVWFNAEIFGTMPLPPVYSTGFHQCRWNYYSAEEVLGVDEGYDLADIPLDAIWLDIEYTAGRSKKYFTWDPITFPNPVELANNLTSKGRRLIAIIDPHIKKEEGYDIYDQATAMDLWIKDPSGLNSFEGWCWPGASYWPDYLSPKVREWWGSKFAPEYFPGGENSIVDIWNDMNEPSIFNGPEVTAPRDLRHVGGWEHRDLHNMYGLLVTMATYQGLAKFRHQKGLDRPYILTRSFFAGSQRYAAAWTGDNMADWKHLKVTVPMLLSISISGLPFIGADVGGFFNNPESEELLIRWHQAGAFQPFFRAHAHHDSKRREAYLFEGQTRQLLRNAIQLRYSYAPYWYTLFFEAHTSGRPMMRPLWFHEPNDEATYNIDDQYLLGYSLLVKPVVDKGVTSINVYLPGESGKTAWYDLNSYSMHQAGKTINVPVDIATVPVFQRVGTIVPRSYRMRRSMDLLMRDPFTLDIVLGQLQGKTGAHGTLFVDDFRTLMPDATIARLVTFSYHDELLQVKASSNASLNHGTIERILIYNWPVKNQIQSIFSAPENESYDFNRPLVYQMSSPRHDGTSVLWIKKPQQSETWGSWTLKIKLLT